MNVSGSAPIEGGGISLRIVDFLEKYQSAVPIAFLAQEFGQRPDRLMEDLSSLEARNVVKINYENQTVGLVEPKKSTLSSWFHWISGAK